MLVKDLKGLIYQDVYLVFERFGDCEKELDGKYTIDELIKKGYGDGKVNKIYTYRNALYILYE